MHVAFQPSLPSAGTCWSSLRESIDADDAAPYAGGAPQYRDPYLSDGDVHGQRVDVFRPDVPRIACDAELVDVPSGARLTSVWINEGEAIASSDYEICRQDLTAGTLSRHARFATRRPVDGWPTGNYRLELLIDGELAQTVRFRVTG